MNRKMSNLLICDKCEGTGEITTYPIVSLSGRTLKKYYNTETCPDCNKGYKLSKAKDCPNKERMNRYAIVILTDKIKTIMFEYKDDFDAARQFLIAQNIKGIYLKWHEGASVWTQPKICE